MEVSEYLDQKRKIYDFFNEFINDEYSTEKNYKQLTSYFLNNGENEMFFHLILRFFKYHHRTPELFAKIKQIILYFKKDITGNFTNSEIFDIFKNDKQIILFLLEEKILSLEKEIIDIILSKSDKNGKRYCHYFYPEIKSKIEETEKINIEKQLQEVDLDILNHFEDKRQNGENDSLICSFIRNDSIEEFIAYTQKINFDLKIEIPFSIFETNPFLLKKNPTIIEYSAFYGSIQIFEYLLNNDIEITPSVWIYAIHSDNAELIHILEERYCKTIDFFDECFNEAIKCHHNEIAQYIMDNYLTEEKINFYAEKDFDNNYINNVIRYHNYHFFPNNFNSCNKFIAFYLMKNNYFELFNILFTANALKINTIII